MFRGRSIACNAGRKITCNRTILKKYCFSTAGPSTVRHTGLKDRLPTGRTLGTTHDAELARYDAVIWLQTAARSWNLRRRCVQYVPV